MLPEAVKRRVEEYFERVLNHQEIDACDEFLSPAYIDHDAPADEPPGPASVKQYLAQFLADVPDLHVTVWDVIAEEQKAAARVTWQGTRVSSGKQVQWMGLLLLHFDAEGRWLERWSAYSTEESTDSFPASLR